MVMECYDLVLNDVLQVTSDFLNDVGLLLLRAATFVFFVITLLLEGLTGKPCAVLNVILCNRSLSEGGMPAKGHASLMKSILTVRKLPP